MATAPRPKRLNEYLVLVPDLPNTQSSRRGAQPAHIVGATPLIEDGRISYFGVTLTKHVIDAPSTGDEGGDHVDESTVEKPGINGSVMVMKAASENGIREFLEADAYTKAGVWDVKNAKIIPFRAG